MCISKRISLRGIMKIYKSIFYVFLILILCVCSFCEEKKEDNKDKGPDVFCVVIYEKNQPVILNCQYKDKINSDVLNKKIEKFKKEYKGNIEIMPILSDSQGNFNAEIKSSNYEVGSGESLEPFINTFCDKKDLIILFAGDYVPAKDPLLQYEKNDFSLIAHIQGSSFQYEIHNNGKEIKLPKGQKSIIMKKTAKKLGVYVLYIVGISVIILLFIKMLNYSVRHNRVKNRSNSRRQK